MKWHLTVLGLLLVGTAQAQEHNPADPWEGWNRKVYSFNDAVDGAVLKPVAKAYVAVTPQPVRTGLTNFYGNVGDVWSAVNGLLQGKVLSSLQDVMRVGTNTLFGMGGLIDLASDIGLDKQGRDFGQTLGRWGVGAGPYVVWPVLGPSTLRESLAMPLNMVVSPSLAIQNEPVKYSLVAVNLVNVRANLLGTTNMIDSMALDKYSFVRDAFLQRRRSLVLDGDEPPEQTEPESPPPAASAPVETTQ